MDVHLHLGCISEMTRRSEGRKQTFPAVSFTMVIFIIFYKDFQSHLYIFYY